MASNFFKNYADLTADITLTIHNKPALKDKANGWIYKVTKKPKTPINDLGIVDGAEEASKLGKEAKQKPFMVIAGNPKHIGGSLYRVAEGKTGDAQEEQAGNTYAGALALACCDDVSKGVEAGNICYTDEVSQLLRNRGAIEVTNVPGIEPGQVCDQLLVAAPDLKNKKECFTKTGEFDYHSYQNQIYTMYNNIFSAIAKKDPNQPIILTLPGVGVFLGEDENSKKQAIIIHGLCLRRVLQEKTDQLKGHNFSLPRAQCGVNAEVMAIVGSEPNELKDKIDELKRLQRAQKVQMFSTIQDILKDAEEKADELTEDVATEDKKKIKENISEIRNELHRFFSAVNENSKTDIDNFSKKITGHIKEILPTAAQHGGLKQDLIYLLAAIMDVVTLGLTAWLVDDSVLKVGVEGDLVSFREKFGLFKIQLQEHVKTESDVPEKDEVHDDTPKRII